MGTYTSEATLGRDRYKTVLLTGRHVLVGDEPLEEDGTDQGPSPFQLVLTGLAACKVMTLRFYADKQQLPLERVNAKLTMKIERVGKETVSEIDCKLQMEGNLSVEQRQKLMEIADKCPVHKMLQGNINITSHL